uniref:Uncharacterized protein n=1 Tax=Globisporangium ultimum (strain ATCC 200006 / CBS 805.95 / DAOM BR144) TaxID=431595 RepID=K3X905_GLOUD
GEVANTCLAIWAPFSRCLYAGRVDHHRSRCCFISLIFTSGFTNYLYFWLGDLGISHFKSRRCFMSCVCMNCNFVSYDFTPGLINCRHLWLNNLGTPCFKYLLVGVSIDSFLCCFFLSDCRRSIIRDLFNGHRWRLWNHRRCLRVLFSGCRWRCFWSHQGVQLKFLLDQQKLSRVQPKHEVRHRASTKPSKRFQNNEHA